MPASTDRPLQERFRRWSDLVAAGAIQAVGSAAALLITILLARVCGPEVQGRFGLAKAEIDFLTALCLVGLPQAVFFFCRQGELSSSAARRLVLIQAGLAGGSVFAWKVLNFQGAGEGIDRYMVSSGFALALAATVSYSVVRGTCLAYRSSRSFSLFSAAPSVFLLGGVSLILVIASANWRAPALDVLLIFALAYGLCALVGYRGLMPRESSADPALSFALVRRLVAYGSATWLASLSQAACSYLALWWIEGHAGGIESAGVFSAGLALVLIAITPINLVVPILFKRWTGASARLRNREFTEIAAVVFCGAVVAVSIMVLKGREVVGLLYGEQYSQFAPVFLVLALAILPQSFMRLWGVLYNAIGRPGLAVYLEMFRFSVLAVGLVAAGTSLSRAAWAWMVAELLTLCLGWLLASRTGLITATD